MIFLENPVNVKTCGQAIKKCIFDMILVLVQKYNQSFSIRTALFQILHQYDHLPSFVVEMMKSLASAQNSTKLISDLMMEIDRDDITEIGAKNLGAFVAEICESIPKVVYSQMLTLSENHLDSEFYQMRNGVLQGLGSILCKYLLPELNKIKEELKAEKNSKLKNKENEEDVDQIQNNEESELEKEFKSKTEEANIILDILEERMLDASGYTRAKTLHIWIQLITEKNVPKSRFMEVTKKVIQRLRDSHSMVRKVAILLLTNLIYYNPYGPHFSLTYFKNKLAAVENEVVKNESTKEEEKK